MGIMKYCALIDHKADINECVEQIKLDWKNATNDKDREIMITNANFGRKLAILCTFFTYSGFVFYNIVIPISRGKVTAEDANISFIPLVFPVSKYADALHSPMNEIIFSLQVMGSSLGYSVASAACSLAAVLAVHTCGQMQVVMNWLNHLIDGRSDMSKRVDGRVGNIVRQHVRILKLYLVLEVKDVYNRIKLFGPLSFCVMAFLKYHLLILHEDDIRECVKRIEWDWKNITYIQDRDLMITYANFGRKLIVICGFFMYSGFAFYYIAIPISVGRIPAEGANVTFIPAVYSFSRFVVDTRYSPVNENVFSLYCRLSDAQHNVALQFSCRVCRAHLRSDGSVDKLAETID
ncbi:hypothetical protein WN51_13779 [Melipona quadrifasciata]|uniref:Odorant receptor n=1 Tax=Melipona quadrifasciata TaxID=166423 RepID=A0A0N0U597_9HYME|nr:hypothetical protein WN51_13779 [Melipona quadrifasciata]